MKTTAILDSRATNHYFTSHASLQHKKAIRFGPEVILPSGNTITPSHTASLNLPMLSKLATKAYIFPHLKFANLLSVGQFCDDNCVVTFDKYKAIVLKNNKIILQGTRDPLNGMWNTFLPTHQLNGIIKKETSKSDLIHFLHAACFSPSPSTWIQAIKRNFFLGWPGLTVEAVRKYLISSPSTHKGHLDQTQKNQASTKSESTPHGSSFDIPLCELDNVKHHVVSATILNNTPGRIYTDQTGRFPVTSALRNKYIFVLYDHDSNAIMTEPLKSREGISIVNAFEKLTDILIKKGLQPRLQILDNEASTQLKEAITKRNITYQLAPPHIHRRNAAERAIRTFKNHLIAGLSSVDPTFPLHQWDQLLEHATITLNLLRPSRLNPSLSAYAYLYGMFNYNSTPLAPPGIKCQIHEKPRQRKSWDPHSVDGFYVGPAMQHYRCHRVYVTKTRSHRISDTVEFLPTKVRMPQTTTLEKLQSSVNDIVELLRKPQPASPFLEFGNEQITALANLEKLFPSQQSSIEPPPNDGLASHHKKVLPAPRVNEPASPRVPTPEQPRVLPATPQLRRSKRLQRKRLLNRLASKPQYRDFIVNLVLKYKFPVAHPVLDPLTGRMMEYRDLLKHPDPQVRQLWERGMCRELGRLAQGFGGSKEATNCIQFINFNQIPTHKKATYARIVAELREQKADPHRIRITAGGNLIFYPHDKSQPAADLNTVKLHINSTISTPGARYACLDIKNMYLNSLMDEPEFMFIDVRYVPKAFMDEYNLHDKVHNGKLYVQINKGMYGLPQAGKLAHDQLKTHLAKYGYTPCPLTPGLWKHATRPISFTLVVDDFGVKYVGQEHLTHLINALKDAYEVTVDMQGSYMLGMTLSWDYANKHVDISMPNYIQNMLTKFDHPKPTRPQHQPHECLPIQYGQKVQFSHEPAPSPSLSKQQTTRIQQIVGTLLYYSRAVDPTMLPAINDISSQQSKPTETTLKHLNQLLDYVATHPNAKIRYHASGMVLHIHSDGSYLSAPCSRSRAAGHFFLSNWPQNIKMPDPTPPPGNGPIFTVCKTLRNVMASAAETELGALFYNGQEAIPLRHALIEMGHPQPPTPIATDNSTALGIVTSSIKQRRSKAMDMRFHWMQDRVRQNHFLVYWAPGNTNLPDYFSKHHPSYHHKNMRSKFLLNLVTTFSHILNVPSPSKGVYLRNLVREQSEIKCAHKSKCTEKANRIYT